MRKTAKGSHGGVVADLVPVAPDSMVETRISGWPGHTQRPQGEKRAASTDLESPPRAAYHRVDCGATPAERIPQLERLHTGCPCRAGIAPHALLTSIAITVTVTGRQIQIGKNDPSGMKNGVGLVGDYQAYVFRPGAASCHRNRFRVLRCGIDRGRADLPDSSGAYHRALRAWRCRRHHHAHHR